MDKVINFLSQTTLKGATYFQAFILSVVAIPLAIYVFSSLKNFLIELIRGENK